MSGRVGVVVLNWNGGAHTITCVDSVRAQEYTERFIVLVDNCSVLEERAQLWARYGGDAQVEILQLPENRGYAGGNNAGIARALARGADLVLVATQDVTLLPGALAGLIETAAAEPRAGIVGPQVIDAAGRHVLSRGERVSAATLCVPRTLLRYRHARSPYYEVTGVMGCALLLTRSCVEAVGAFDEQFFAYYEEVDLCLRARKQGFRIVCTPHAVVTHPGMRGFRSGFTAVSAELKARNLPRLMYRWAGPADWIVLLPTYAALLAASIVLYAARGRMDIVRALIRGTIAGLRQGPLGAAVRAS
jgi:hypothetical protein